MSSAAPERSPMHAAERPSQAAAAARRAGTENRLLAAFSRRDRARLEDVLEPVRLVRGQVLFEAGRVPSHVHFPHAGAMISLVLPLRHGQTSETVTVGLEGAAGMALDPTDASVEAFTRGVVQMPGPAARVPVTRLAEAAAASLGLHRLLSRYAEAAMSMALQSVACNGSHVLRDRLARWLLTTMDRRPEAAPDGPALLPLTQEFLGEMLAVRRATVAEALLGFQAEGLVRLRRGGLLVLDRAGLEQAACECYQAVRGRYERLLGGVMKSRDA